MRRLLLLTTGLILFATTPVAAATLGVQGVLRSQSGGPATAGEFVVFFRLYGQKNAPKAAF